MGGYQGQKLALLFCSLAKLNDKKPEQRNYEIELQNSKAKIKPPML